MEGGADLLIRPSPPSALPGSRHCASLVARDPATAAAPDAWRTCSGAVGSTGHDPVADPARRPPDLASLLLPRASSSLELLQQRPRRTMEQQCLEILPRRRRIRRPRP
ncbi:hypothetical protein BRADI_3g37156v3 [Brachypodium distachyon]|uniref:Uncharacterized protein n=1 Tax=Brachypodium distachyon TaxID=15368 RepID=A0A0Q3M1V7_BRADI|nr:hypothetical protein BRADI_3g37156v3 [Brachypodium distachyon]